jgi:hypothetical protein
VGAVILWHEFGNPCFAFAFIIVAAVFGGEHNKVSNLVDVLWCLVFVGVVCLMDFGGCEVVLGLLDVKCNMCDNIVCSGLFCGGICGQWGDRWDDAGRSTSLQLESREAGGCVYGVHHGEPYTGEFG